MSTKLLHIDNPFEKDQEAEEALQDTLVELKNDPLVYDRIAALSLTKNEVKEGIATLIEFQKDFHVCENCPGLANCPKDHAGYQMDIVRLRGKLQPSFSPCRLLEEYERERAKYAIRDFPEEWLKKGLRDIEHSSSTRNPLLKNMLSILKGKSAEWLFVKGDKKMGKSFVLACFANEYAAKNPGVAFINTREVFNTLKMQSIGRGEKGKFARNMDLLCTCPLLVFDDFGLAFQSAYVFETILSPIIKARNEAGLLTAFSSVSSLDSIASGYKKKVDADTVNSLFSIIKKKVKTYDITGVALYS